MTGEKTYPGLRFWALFFAGLSFVALTIMLAVVTVHAAWPTDVPTAVLNPLFYILSGASGASVVLGAFWFLFRYPQHRTVLLILLLLTTGILVAHFYTINQPAFETPGTLSDPLGTTVKDNQVTLTSTLIGSNLAVTVNVSGGNAIGSLALAVGNTVLPISEMNFVPTPVLALQPSANDFGNFSLQSVPSGPVTLTYQTLTCYDLGKQVDGCVMDEIYYVPAAQALLSGEKCGPYLDNCNLEHPFLSKAVIAAGIAVFGNNDFGWRFFEVLMGTLCIPILFAICWSVTRDSTLSIFAAFLLAFETLFFTQSSIAVIDIQAIFFALLAFMVYLANIRIWRLDRITLAAILLGLSALSKETAIFLVAFLVVYNLIFGAADRKSKWFSSIRLLVVVAVVFIVGLQLYVTLFGNSSTTTFVDDIRYILSYGASLKCTPSSCGWTDPLFHNAPITPFSWMTFYSAVGYFVTRVTINPGNYQYVSLGYWGVSNFFEVWLTWAWAPLVAFLSYKLWTSRAAVVADVTTAVKIDNPSFRIAQFALLWFVITYFAYVALYFYGRVTYPYYVLPATPAISIGCAYLLSRKRFPREVAYVLLGGVFLWFFLYYPDKSFLPGWLRMFLGH
jgi:4-amino-4-deoxy-L-arabinose transferase-like glycosyltransferase